MNMNANPNRSGRIRVGVVVLLVLGVAGVAVFFLKGTVGAKETKHDEHEAPESQVAISVNAIHPRLGEKFLMTVERPCTVNAYFTDVLEARAAGVVKNIYVDIGSKVKKGDLLVEIDVPDRVADMNEKHNIVGQREKEWDLSKEKVKAAEAMVETAKANIEERKALVQQAVADEEYRQADFNRLFNLRKSNSVDQNVVDVAQRALGYAKATVFSSKAAVVKAESQLEDAKANLGVAKADRDEKEKLIDVAKSNYERAKALRGYAIVRSPYDATVVERFVGPGSTVQDSTSGKTSPMLKLQRKDIVTVSMQLPDKSVPYVTAGTEAIMEFDGLPGLKITGRVSRFSDSLTSPTHDRTMRVEVDLWNGSEKEFEAFKADKKNRADLKPGALPVMPQFIGKNRMNLSTDLKPDTYGKMTLVLRTFANTYLIPSQALLREGGRTKIYIVQDGKAHLQPVEVQVDDGVFAKVERLDDQDHILGDLTASEEVVVSNQEELSEGQLVKPTLVGDWKTLEKKKH